MTSLVEAARRFISLVLACLVSLLFTWRRRSLGYLTQPLQANGLLPITAAKASDSKAHNNESNNANPHFAHQFDSADSWTDQRVVGASCLPGHPVRLSSPPRQLKGIDTGAGRSSTSETLSLPPPPRPSLSEKEGEAKLPDSESQPNTPPFSPSTPPATTMAERTLQKILQQLHSSPPPSYAEAAPLLSKAKLALIQLNALTPSATSTPQALSLARSLYECGALSSIRARNPDAFTRYVSQLAPFYELADNQSPSESESKSESMRNKVTGLYLLLLLTQGRYSEFHSELETLATRQELLVSAAATTTAGSGKDKGKEMGKRAASLRLEDDRFLGYPIKLERWLMEGSYDRVWKAMKRGEVPSEEYAVFSEILTSQIRSEIASSSERAYPSLPLSSTKSLLFLDSEGAVVDFARERGWLIRDGYIYFPHADGAAAGAGATGVDDALDRELGQMTIENTLGYARELETIV